MEGHRLLISEAEFYGGSRAEAPSADTTVGEDDVRLIVYSPTVAVDVLLPPFSTQQRFEGGPRFYLINDSAFLVRIKRSDGSPIQTLGVKIGNVSKGVVLHVGPSDWVRRLLNSEAGVTS